MLLPAGFLVSLAALLASPVPGREAAEAAGGAPPFAPTWQVESFLEDADLVGGSVLHFDFASDGTGWFATSVGLLRFDGFEWERFTTADGLPGNYVRSVCAASDGRLWVGTDRWAGVFAGGRFDDAGTRGRLAGPSVRRIVETSDGALYFCCDRWPEAEVDAGLTRLADGRWTTWRSADGLPSDYVSDVFEASDGRLFVLTNRGLALFSDGAFRAPLEEAGLWARPEYVWSMVESARHGLLVATRDHVYQEREDGWRRLENSAPLLYLPKLASTSAGEVLACHQEDGRTVFLAFDGEAFVPVTERLSRAGEGVELVREDPAGGIWAGGFDRLLRWNRSGPGWSESTGSGTPLGCDADGGLWLQLPGDRLARLGERREELDGSRPVMFDPAGPVWYTAPGELRRHSRGEVRRFRTDGLGLETPRLLCVDAAGALWATDGHDRSAGLVRVSADGRSRVALAPEPNEDLGDAAADPDGGVWCTLLGRGGGEHRLLFLGGDGPREVELPGRVQMTSAPVPHVDSDGQLWLLGFFGAYRLDRRGDAWTRFEDAPGMVSGIAEVEGERWFVGPGHLSGHGGVVRATPRATTRLDLPRARLMGSGRERFLVSGAEVRSIVPGLDGVPPAIVIPTHEQIHAVERDGTGAIWVRAGDVTLRRTFGSHAPRPVLLAGDTRLQQGERLALELGARQHLRAGVDRVAAVGSWSIDGGPWSAWSDLREPLVADDLPAGEHRVRVRVRDGAGHVSSPFEVGVSVLPVPLQQRPWFLPLVAGTVVALGSLTLFALRARGDLAAQKLDLEHIVERRTAEARASERRYRTLFEQARDAVLLFQLDGILVGANRSAHELLGSDEGLPGSIAEVFATPADAERFQAEAAGSADVGPVRTRVRARTGEVRDVLLSARRWYDEGPGADLWQMVLADVTELVRLEERLRQAEKMDALGRMAGGVAHDFNNLLTVILGFAETARPGEPDLEEHLEQIVGAATRAKALVQQIQLFGRSRVGEPPVVDAAEALASIGKRIAPHLGAGVELSVDLPRRLGWIRIEPPQLEQALVNLAVNATHAMPSGGRLSIAASQLETDGSDEELPRGRWLRIDVEDEGDGMDSETLARAMEPFFTTKPVGRGTGLGLAIVYGVVQLAKGHVRIESRPGAGTRVRLHLPLCSAPRQAVLPASVPAGDTGGSERILVVEDETQIAQLIEATLRKAGYEVVLVGEAEAALERLACGRETLELLVTDVVMPGGSGIGLVQRAHELRPDLPVVVVSGYPRSDARDGMLAELDVPFLAKPFRARELLEVVRATLDRERTATG